MILAGYTGAGPDALSLVRGAHGKPALAPPLSWLRFNLAHSGGLALVACARGREVGIDLEQIRPDAADEAIAAHLFSSREQAELRALPAGRRAAGFFACWTRKEAYVKARGLGLSLHLADFDVPLEPEMPATRIALRNAPETGGDWWLRDVPLGTQYAAAIAAEGPGWQVRQCHWNWAAG
jgi:4'-phosphopantetheinyl transferase